MLNVLLTTVWLVKNGHPLQSAGLSASARCNPDDFQEGRLVAFSPGVRRAASRIGAFRRSTTVGLRVERIGSAS